MSLVASIVSKFDDSGVKKAQTAFGGLKKALSIGLAIEGLKKVGEELIKFAEVADKDQKSMQLLNMQLERNAHATKAQTKQNEKFIISLSQQVGMTKDRLRPAQAKLARVTHDVTKSQKLLKLALDASAVSGKPLETVSLALAKAYAGNTGALARMFPELKKSKNALADLNKEVSGAAAQQANPFDRLNVAMTNLQIKIGNIILPYFEKFVDAFTKPGGMGDQIGIFFDEISNPKTEIGKTFVSLKGSVDQLGQSLSGLFAMMDPKGNKNPMAGFSNMLQIIGNTMVNLIDGGTVLGGILSNISTGNYINAMALAAADIGVGAQSVKDNLTVAKEIEKINAASIKNGRGPLITGNGAFQMEGSPLGGSSFNDVNFGKSKNTKLTFGNQNVPDPNNPFPNTQINIHVHSADPKAVVDALGKYVKTNGNLPKILTNRNGR